MNSREIDDEIASHLAEAASEYAQQGLSPEEARRAAQRSFGSVAQAREVYRQVRSFMWLEELSRDVRYALRTLRKNPTFTTTATATLALAIGTTTAMFSVVNAVLLRPLPYQSPDQLVMLWTEDSALNLRDGRSALWDVERWRRQSQTFADMATFDSVSTVMAGADGAEQIVGASISANLLPMLGVQPILGRSFSIEEAEQRQRLVLISHRFWQARFGGSHDALGATLVLNGSPSQIVGILPAGFQLGKIRRRRVGAAPDRPQRARPRDVVRRWKTPAGHDARPGPGGNERTRPPPQRSIARGRTEPGHQPRPIEPVHGGSAIAIGIVDARRRRVLRVSHRRCQCDQSLPGAHTARAREMAVRAALGAGAGRIVRQLLTESVVLAVVSGLMGTLLAVGGIRLIRAFGPGTLPRLNEVRVDLDVLSWALVVLCACGSPGGTGASDFHVAPRSASVRRGEWEKCLGREIHSSSQARSRGGGVCACDRCARRGWSARPQLVVCESHQSGIQAGAGAGDGGLPARRP